MFRMFSTAAVAITLSGTILQAQTVTLAEGDDWLVMRSDIGERSRCLIARKDGGTALFYFSVSADSDGDIMRGLTFQPPGYDGNFEDRPIDIVIGDFAYSGEGQFKSNRFVVFFDPEAGAVQPYLTGTNTITTVAPGRREQETWSLEGIDAYMPAFQDCQAGLVGVSN